LSSVLDPTLDADVTPLGTAALQKLYTDYRAKYGDFLSPDADPSSDQLASLKQVITAGSSAWVAPLEETDLHLLHPQLGDG